MLLLVNLIVSLGLVANSRDKMDSSVQIMTVYSVENQVIFILTCLQASLFGIFLIAAQLATDTFFVGVLLRLSSQIDILKYRLKLFDVLSTREAKRRQIIDCVIYHNRIYRYISFF